MAKGTTPTSPTRSIGSCRTACREPTACSRICCRWENKKPAQFLAPAQLQSTELPTYQLLKGVPEAEHHDVDVRCLARDGCDRRRGLQRVRDQVAIEVLEIVRKPAVRVGARVRQDLGVHETLTNTPVMVQEVAEVRDVQA